VLVRVHAVSLNFRDIAMLRGRYPRKCVPGLIPVSDAAGEIVATGEGVEAFKVGDRVIGAFHPRWFGGEMPSTIQSDSYGAENDGWLCEFKAISQEAVVRLPDALSYEEGSTLPMCRPYRLDGADRPQAHTRRAYGARAGQRRASPSSPFQLARAVGATVIATTSSAAKSDRLKALGAADVVNYVDDPQWGRSVRTLTGGRGVDRVVEVGGP
jgi:alcohol dehydrogenase